MFTNGLLVDCLKASCSVFYVSHLATNTIVIASILFQNIESCILILVMGCFQHCVRPRTSTVSEGVGISGGSVPQKNIRSPQSPKIIPQPKMDPSTRVEGWGEAGGAKSEEGGTQLEWRVTSPALPI